MRRLRVLGVLIATIAAVIPVLVLPAPAAASSTCASKPDGLHCYGYKYDTDNTHGYPTGMQMSANLASVTKGDATFIDPISMWFQLSDGTVLEMGTTVGAGCSYAYCGYAAVNAALVKTVSLTADNSRHNMEISYAGSNTWKFWWDPQYGYTQLVYSYTDSSTIGCVRPYNGCIGSEAGGEILGQGSTPVDSTQSVSTINIQALKWKLSGTWTAWSMWGYWLDNPCGTYPAGQCLNGTSPANDQWSWNKP